MSKKQSDYLASLLAEEALTPDAPPAVDVGRIEDVSPPPADVASTAHRTGLSLLGRENALARVADGEVRQVTQLLLDPKRVRIWAGNARIQQQLNEENCRDLIDSILAEGGQKVPAIVRHVHDDPQYNYEVVAGTRRHFAISWLRANSYPEMRLLAQVAVLDDEAAFRLADVENRARKDISEVERARNYAAALDRHYGGKAVRMAERLNVSKGWLSKMLKAASIPDAALAAFANPGDLTLNPAYKLAVALDDKARAKVILKEAATIAAENGRAIAQGSPPLPAATVLKRLHDASVEKARSPIDFRMQISAAGLPRPVMAVKSVNRQGITLHLPMASGASDAQLADALQQLLDGLRINGVTVS